MLFRRKKQSLFNRLAAFVFIVSLLMPFINPAFAQADVSGDIDDLALQSVRNNYGFYRDGQAVDGGWGNFSAYDAYILEEAGVYLDSWVYDGESFSSRVISLIDSSIENEGEGGQSSAKRIAGEYLAARSMGEDGRADDLLQILQDRQALGANGSFDSSDFSDIPALEMMGRSGDLDEIDTDSAIDFILGEQDAASGAWTSSWNDLMTTAEAVRALDYLIPYAGDQEETVSDAVYNGMEWLRSKQLDDGSFQDDYGFDDPVVDTAEVAYTLILLDIDPEDWISDEGNSPVDYLCDGAVNSDGTFGASSNVAANTWVLDAYLQLGANIESDCILGIEVSPSSATIDKGETQQFTAEAYTIAGTIDDVTSTATWAVQDPDIASIDMGLAAGTAEGTTAVTAEYEGISSAAELTVQDSASPGDIDDLALQAVRNNYGFYRDGQVVDGGWGNFSAYDAYILEASGAELDSWIYDGEDFASLVIELIDNSIENEGEGGQSSAKRITGEYLAARSMGEDGRADDLLQILQDRQALGANGSFDSSDFSDIPALEMMGRSGDLDEIDTDSAIDFILGEQDAASGAWTSSWNDLMTTAEAVRALDYLIPYAGDQEETVSDAVYNGMEWLRSKQLDDGSFQDDYGFDDPVVDTAEVAYTLILLDIDPEDWISDEGNSPVDYLCDGSVNSDGTFGASSNVAANTWALDAYLQLGADTDSDGVLGIELSPSSATINKGETQQFTAEAYTLAGTTEDVTSTATWTVEDPDIASIDMGLATGTAAGAANIRARYGGISGFAVLTVEKSGSSGGRDDNIKAYIAVVGDDGELLFAPRRVTMDPDDTYGLTAVGALDATGLSWSYTTGLVTDIEGQSNENMNGWMCKINDVPLSISAFESEVEQGDEVIWWYSYDPYSDGPDMDDLKGGGVSVGGGAAVTSPLAQSTEDIFSLYSDQLDHLQGNTTVNNTEKRMTAEEVSKLQNELEKNQVYLEQQVRQEMTVISDEMQEIAVLVPAHAVSGTATISIEEVINDDSWQQFALRIGSSVYEFGPNGSEFDEPLTICIKMPITGDMDLSKLSPAWYDSEREQWIPIPAVIDLENGLVLFRIDHFTSFAVIQFPDRLTFTDVNSDISWAREAIEVLAGQGIIKGTSKGFEPGRYISRAEFVQLMVKALDLSSTSNSGIKFTDIKSGDWFADAVGIACANDIISGYPDATFRPEKPITRNEIASILQRLQVDDNLSGVELDYVDQSAIPAWALAGLKFSCQANLMNGYEDGTFRGNNSLSRAEAAVTVYRYLNYLVGTGYKL